MRPFVVLIAALFFFAPIVRAHGDLEERIAAVTKKIDATPGDAKLYLDRADLHRLHADFVAAKKDVERAFALQPDMPYAHVALAAILLDENKPKESLDEIALALKSGAVTPDLLLLKARALGAAERWTECADAYDAAIQASAQPAPDHYLGRAEALMRAAPFDVERTRKGLEDGLAKCGPAITLKLKLIDALAQGKKIDDAVKTLDEIIAASPRKETWLLKRGDIFAAADRKADAKAAYLAALDAVKKLSPRLQSLVTTKDIVRRAESSIEKLEEVKK